MVYILENSCMYVCPLIAWMASRSLGPIQTPLAPAFLHKGPFSWRAHIYLAWASHCIVGGNSGCISGPWHDLQMSEHSRRYRLSKECSLHLTRSWVFLSCSPEGLQKSKGNADQLIHPPWSDECCHVLWPLHNETIIGFSPIQNGEAALLTEDVNMISKTWQRVSVWDSLLVQEPVINAQPQAAILPAYANHWIRVWGLWFYYPFLCLLEVLDILLD